MHVKSLSQGLNVDLVQPGLELGTSWSRSQVSTTRPQRHIYQNKSTETCKERHQNLIAQDINEKWSLRYKSAKAF